MNFRMAVVPPSRPRNLVPDFDLTQDSDALVMDACGLLATTDCRFRVSGFGQDEWPVDVAYDLSTVIEQVPQALDDFREGFDAEIDFYGQGVERLVTFAPDGETTQVRCTSRTSWTPDPEMISCSHHDVENLLTSLEREFVTSLRLASPTLAALPPFATWL
ncbi:hypothetical protein [Streptomyces sp. B6B3]|uniref:hypothetical protein n=1 Tax=Streptomyces sp. B6B3 TaxID=3153570 RepID=UPI00325E5100